MRAVTQGTETEYNHRHRLQSFKEVRLPRMPEDSKPSTTKVLQLIKLKRNELNSYSHLKTEEDTYKSTSINLPRIKTTSDYYNIEPATFETPATETREAQISLISNEPIPIKQKQREESESDIPKEEDYRAKRFKSVGSEEEDEVETGQLTLYEQFCKLLSNIPQLGKHRNVKNMQPFVQFLLDDNNFFRSLPPVLINSLLKVCSIRTFSKGQQVYRKADKLISFYIILWGKIRISDVLTNYKRSVLKGQTFSQQILFNTNGSKIRAENAKALRQSTVLQVPVYLYKKIYEELTLYGYKNDFLMMEAIIRRNYIDKQSNRQR